MTEPLPGEVLRCRFLVRSATLERIRQGWLWRAHCLMPDGAFEAVAFASPCALNDVISPPQIVEATLVGTSRGLQIEECNPHPEEAGESWDYLPRGPLDENDAWEHFEKLLNESITHPDWMQVRDDLFADEDFCQRFRRAPAALQVHHPWRGGLLEHVLSMFKSAPALCKAYDADLSLVSMGIWLHDVGKLWEIDPVAGQYTREGELIGHLIQGTAWLARRLQAIDIDKTLSTELLHCLVSHHGTLENGSPRAPMSAEALVVHTLDRLDSEMFQITTATNLPGTVSPRNPWLGRKIYRSVM